MKNLFASAALVASLLLSGALASAAPVVYFDPAQQTVAGGATFTVDVKVKDLGAELVSAFDFNILFDAAVLTGTLVSLNASQFGVSAFGPAVIGAGNIGFGGLSFETDSDLAALQTDDAFTLFTLTFLAASVDAFSTLSFGEPPLFDRNLVGLNGDTLNARFDTACVLVGAADSCNKIPEPASFALVGLALVCALTPGAWRRRRNRA